MNIETNKPYQYLQHIPNEVSISDKWVRSFKFEDIFAIAYPLIGGLADPQTPQLRLPRMRPSSNPITIMLLGEVYYILRNPKVLKRSWKYFSNIFRLDENMTPSFSHLVFIAGPDFFSPQR